MDKSDSSESVWLSVIIPVFNEEAALPLTLSLLEQGCTDGVEVIVADGGSTDGSAAVCAGKSVRWVNAEKGRAAQMNAGANVAKGSVLVFLHADTRIPPGFVRELGCFRASHKFWGRFNVALDGKHWAYRLISLMINQRSCCTGIATGDQAIFVKKSVFDIVGGFPDIPLMEDVEFSARLSALDSPLCSRMKVVTSSRRWENNGIVKTVLLMWWLRLQYFFGVSPERLAKIYYPQSHGSMIQQ
ncbi:MAG: glycosyl transferase [Proteobacteria bacterium]|nr:MAG: glycosyl transferase [Pseudomonadota bacterium]